VIETPTKRFSEFKPERPITRPLNQKTIYLNPHTKIWCEDKALRQRKLVRECGWNHGSNLSSHYL